MPCTKSLAVPQRLLRVPRAARKVRPRLRECRAAAHAQRVGICGGKSQTAPALHGTVAEGDKLVAVNGSAVGLLPLDELIGLLALQDDGVTPRGLVFHRKGAREYNKGGLGCSLS